MSTSTALPGPGSTGPAWAPGPAADLEAAARGEMLTRSVVVGAVVLTGLRIPLPLGVVPGLLVAVVLAPLWVPSVRRYRGARLLFALTGAALLNGWWLHETAMVDHLVDTGLAIGTTLLVAGVVAGVGVLLWAREHLPDRWVAVWLAVGLAGGELFERGQWGDNPWKFAFVVPASLLVLAVARMTGQRLVELVALLALGLFSTAQDSRSAFAIFLLASTLILWQIVPVPAATRRRYSVLKASRTALLLAAVAASVYNIGSALLLDGLLGDAAQQRSALQVHQSGSLLLGGRPELAATTALMAERPAGFGPGTMASPQEVLVARTGMEAIGYDTANGYVERFMFGTQMRLHSVVGELWAFFGAGGLLLALALLVVLASALANTLSLRAASGFTIWLTCLTAWNAFFGPLYGSAAALLATVGLVLVARDDPPPHAAAPVVRTPGR